MLLRNQSRRCDAANFTDLTMGGWGAGFEKARDAYASVGSTKKKALMEQMLKRLEEKPATSNASAGVNTPSKSPASRYSFNYDRFKNIEDSDDEEERGPAPSPPITVPTQTPPVPTNLPPKLVDAMMRAQEARSRGASPEEVRPTAPVLYRKIVSLVHVRERSAHTRGHQARALSFHYCCAVQLKMVEALAAEGLKDADPETKLEVIKMLIEGGVELPPAVLALASAGTEETKTMAQAEVVQEQLREMQQKMTSDLEALKKQQQELNKREDLLSSANTFDDLLKFMQKVRASGPAAFYSSSNAGFADPAIGRRQSGMSQEEIAGAMQAQERQDTGAVREILEKSVKRGIDTSGAVLAAKRLEENLRTVEAATASAAGKKGESKAKEDVGGAGKANTAAVKSQEPSTNSAELSADEQQKAADEKELGNVAFAAGKYTKALKHFSKAIELGGDCAAYLTNRAAALVRLERYAEALADVERALALDKTHVKAWFRKGQALEGLGRFADAVGAYEAGLRVLPDSPQLVKGIENARAKLAASSGADGAGGGGGCPGSARQAGGTGGGGGDVSGGRGGLAAGRSRGGNPHACEPSGGGRGRVGGGGRAARHDRDAGRCAGRAAVGPPSSLALCLLPRVSAPCLASAESRLRVAGAQGVAHARRCAEVRPLARTAPPGALRRGPCKVCQEDSYAQGAAPP